MSSATALAIEPAQQAIIHDASFVASLNRIKGFLGTTEEMTSVAETLAPHSVEWVKSLSDAELLPLGEKALHDIADDILVLDEIRQRFRRTPLILGYNGWKDFVTKNSRYSIRTIQRRLSEKNGKDESKVNHTTGNMYTRPPRTEELPEPATSREMVFQPDPSAPISCAFEELISALYCLTKSGNDGVEHRFIGMMDAALARCESTPTVGDGRETVIYLLQRISEEFMTYAQRLEKTVPLRTVPATSVQQGTVPLD
jgi:hypothetical protein